jgi:hypothetical protein
MVYLSGWDFYEFRSIYASAWSDTRLVLPCGKWWTLWNHTRSGRTIYVGCSFVDEVWDIQTQKLDGRVDPSSLQRQCFGQRKTEPSLRHLPLTRRSRLSKLLLKDTITGLALSFDCALLASASLRPRQHHQALGHQCIKSHQLLASFDQSDTHFLVLSPDSRKLAYTIFALGPLKIYICNVPPDILTNVWPAQGAPSVCIPCKH